MSQAQALAPQDAIREIVKASGTSFYWGMRILPPDRRNAVFALYAFCREVDDIADEPGTLEDKRAALADWRQEIDALYNQTPQKLETVALSHAIDDYALRKEDFLAIIDGMETDASGPVRCPDLDSLKLYCDQVACAVGRLCIHIFGEPNERGHRVANHLGMALQLTNILRDVGEDATMGRMYLPLEFLERHGIQPGDPSEMVRLPALIDVCKDVAAWAEQEYEHADNAMAACDPTAVKPARIMRNVYWRTFAHVRESLCDNKQLPQTPYGLKRLVLKAEKTVIALKTALG